MKKTIIKIVVIGLVVCVYSVYPFDAISDITPVIGQLDDALVSLIGVIVASVIK